MADSTEQVTTNETPADRTGNGAFYFDRRSGFADDCGSVPRL